MNETYVGGKRLGQGGRGTPSKGSHKVSVFGTVERRGKVRAVVVLDVSRASVLPHVRARVIPAG